MSDMRHFHRRIARLAMKRIDACDAREREQRFELNCRVRFNERLARPQLGRLMFERHARRVEVRARWFSGRRHTTTVSLADLSPKTATLLVRNRLVKQGIVLGSLAIAAAVVLSRPGFAPWMQALALAGWPVGIACFGLAAISFRKTPFVRFLRRDGRPGLDARRDLAPRSRRPPGRDRGDRRPAGVTDA